MKYPVILFLLIFSFIQAYLPIRKDGFYSLFIFKNYTADFNKFYTNVNKHIPQNLESENKYDLTIGRIYLSENKLIFQKKILYTALTSGYATFETIYGNYSYLAKRSSEKSIYYFYPDLGIRLGIFKLIFHYYYLNSAIENKYYKALYLSEIRKNNCLGTSLNINYAFKKIPIGLYLNGTAVDISTSFNPSDIKNVELFINSGIDIFFTKYVTMSLLSNYEINKNNILDLQLQFLFLMGKHIGALTSIQKRVFGLKTFALDNYSFGLILKF